MKTFGQFLTGSRSGSLYHGTDIQSAVMICQTNRLEVSSDENAVCLTRSFEFARQWNNSSRNVVFELDQRRLSYDYSIQPFNYFNSTYTRQSVIGDSVKFTNQMEERISRDVINLNRYIIKIHIFEPIDKLIMHLYGLRYTAKQITPLITHDKLFYNGQFVNA